MDKFIKRIQTRLSRQDVRVTRAQVREVYKSVVVDIDNPSDEELDTVGSRLASIYGADDYSQNELATTEQASPAQYQEQSQGMAQDHTPSSNGALATATRGGIQQATKGELGVTQQQIQQAVESQFGRENQETKQAILNYVAQDTFSTAQELQRALAKLRDMRLDILMKLINDHNAASSEDENLLKTALVNATAQRQRETEDFFGDFETQMRDMRAAFGI